MAYRRIRETKIPRHDDEILGLRHIQTKSAIERHGPTKGRNRPRGSVMLLCDACDHIETRRPAYQKERFKAASYHIQPVDALASELLQFFDP